MIWKLDRLGRSLPHLLTTVTDLKTRGVAFRSLTEQMGAALIAAHDDAHDAFGAIATVLPWERFRTTEAEAAALARPEEFDVLQDIGQHFAGIRCWSPALLETFAFEGVPACASLMRAVTVLREANRTGRALPKSAPTGFVRQRWAAYVLPAGGIDRSHDELCVVSELRDRLPAGDVWVTGSRQSATACRSAAVRPVRGDVQRWDVLVVRAVLLGGWFRTPCRPAKRDYGYRAGFKIYTHISDPFAPYVTRVIAATASEAQHVRDALLYHQTDVTVRRDHTDGGGYSDHVFELCSIPGFRFAPRASRT